jgi:branched-chain amino acid transport system substrate-binding protein
MAQMKKTPINDFFAKNGKIRDDGRMVHDMYLLQVKKPAESKGPGTTTSEGHHPGGRGLPAAVRVACPLVKK